MRAALIDGNGNVVNIIVADASVDSAPDGFSLVNCPEGVPVNIGDTYVNGEFVPAPVDPEPVVVPAYVTSAQARLFLLSINKLDEAETLISQQSRAAQIEWQYRDRFYRYSPVLTFTASEMGLTEEEIDQFFISASEL